MEKHKWIMDAPSYVEKSIKGCGDQAKMAEKVKKAAKNLGCVIVTEEKTKDGCIEMVLCPMVDKGIKNVCE